MPYYWSQIETLDNLQRVAGLVDGFNQDRFLAALMGRPMGKEKLVRLRNELTEVTNKLEEEYLVLEDFGKTFNDKFVYPQGRDFDACVQGFLLVLSPFSTGSENAAETTISRNQCLSLNDYAADLASSPAATKKSQSMPPSLPLC